MPSVKKSSMMPLSSTAGFSILRQKSRRSSITAAGISFDWVGGVSANLKVIQNDGTTEAPGDLESDVFQLPFNVCLCKICGDITGHTVDFEISHGQADNLLLRVCRWCRQDFVKLGFRCNQVLAVRKKTRARAHGPIILELAIHGK